VSVIKDESLFLREATLRLCGNLEVDGLHQMLAYLRLEGFALGYLAQAVYVPELGAARITAQVSPDEGRAVDRLIPLSPDARAFIHAAVLPGLSARPGQSPVGRQLARALGRPAGSCLAFLLPLVGRPPAIVVLFADEESSLTEQQVRLLNELRTAMVMAVGNALAQRDLLLRCEELADDLRFLQHELRRGEGPVLVGADGGLGQVMERVRQVADEEGPVLVLGEVGTGKGLVARAIHDWSSRRAGPFVEVNAASIDPLRLDGELFGDETGAAGPRRGHVERARGGTLLLSGVDRLPRSTQVRLLHLVREGAIERVGGVRSIRLDLRLVAASHADLPARVQQCAFREDLHHQLTRASVEVPPLRERVEDLAPLVRRFLESRARELGLVPPLLAPGALERLAARDWPGNVRELRLTVERELLRDPVGPLAFEEAPATLPPAPPTAGAVTLDQAMARHIAQMLELCDGRVNGPGGAAEVLGVHPNTLRHRMRRLEIPFGRARGGGRSS